VRVFFIISTLPLRCTAGADDPNGPRALGKANQEELILGRTADDDFALLHLRVGFVIENRSEWVSKNCGSLLEGYTVFLLIGSGFVLIPLEL
jgi:hypothetical protein